jgi:hypothetical protein
MMSGCGNRCECPAKCPEACGRRIKGDGIEYGIPGLKICGSVAPDADDVAAWSYFVICAVVGRQVRGKYPSRAKSFDELVFWLRQFGCPGHLPDERAGP